MGERTTSLNGGQTRPLTEHSYSALRLLARGPTPRQEINAGVCDRLEREHLVEVIQAPSPYTTNRGKPIRHLRITDAGRAALEQSNG